MPIITAGIELKDSDFPLLTETIITQQGIEKNSSTIPFTRLIQLNTALDALQPIPPNNHTVLFEDTINVQNVGATQTAILNNNSLSLQGTGVTPTSVTIQADFNPPNNTNIVITDNVTFYNASTVNSSVVGNIITGTSTTLTDTALTIDNLINGYQTQISPAVGLFNDSNGGNPLEVEIVSDHTLDPDPYIRMKNFNGFNNFIKFSGIYSNKNLCFVFNNDIKFFKQDNPFSMQQYELLDGETIERYMPLVYTENTSGLRLRDPSEYLDDNGLAGWSTIVTNNNGGSIVIITNGITWYSHSNGSGGDPITIKKWSTCRITLVYSSINSIYQWAVSEF